MKIQQVLDRQDSELANNTTYKLRNLFVLYTGFRETVIALRQAATLANGLTDEVQMVVMGRAHDAFGPSPHADLAAFTARYFQTGMSGRTHFRVTIALCQYDHSSLGDLLPEASTVVIAGATSLLKTAEQRLACLLQKQGHHVIFIEVN